jgi:hypothetical protein
VSSAAGGSTAGMGAVISSLARDVGLAAGAGQQPVVADAMKPLRQNVGQEAPDELVGAERHCAVTKPTMLIALISGSTQRAGWV